MLHGHVSQSTRQPVSQSTSALLTPLFATLFRQSVNQTACQSVHQCPAYSIVCNTLSSISQPNSLSISPPVPCLILCLQHSFVNQSTKQPVNQSTSALLTPLFATLFRQSVNQTACQSVHQTACQSVHHFHAYSFVCCTVTSVSQPNSLSISQPMSCLLLCLFTSVSQPNSRLSISLRSTRSQEEEAPI